MTRLLFAIALLLLTTPLAHAQEPVSEVFEVVEEMPQPIGGIAAVQERIEYPDLARREGVEGRVFVQFVVNAEGQPEDIRVVRGIGSGADEAAVAAVARSPFTPGRQGGEIVKVRMSLPITFRLASDAEERPTPNADEPDVYEVVEQMPEILGGIEAVQQEIRYPREARREGIAGRVFVQFVVNTDGWAEDIRVVQGIGGGADEAAIVAIARTRFTPGQQGGQVVPVRMALPVTFRLSD